MKHERKWERLVFTLSQEAGRRANASPCCNLHACTHDMTKAVSTEELSLFGRQEVQQLVELPCSRSWFDEPIARARLTLARRW